MSYDIAQRMKNVQSYIERLEREISQHEVLVGISKPPEYHRAAVGVKQQAVNIGYVQLQWLAGELHANKH